MAHRDVYLHVSQPSVRSGSLVHVCVSVVSISIIGVQGWSRVSRFGIVA